jgi:dimethylargininase
MFTHAIVRAPCPEIIHGITSAQLGRPDYREALKQHRAYVDALRYCGLEVTELAADSRYPDSTFIEDVALCTPAGAVICRPGAPSRRGETEGMQKVLAPFFTRIAEVGPPGTLEAGDIMMTGDHYYIGLSERTNPEGARQLIAILESFGFSASATPVGKVLHLKTGMSYLENNRLLAGGEFVEAPAFSHFHQIIVSPEEAYAANSLWINGKVLVPAGFPQTCAKIAAAGCETIDLDVSEFQKLDGGLSCLSLRF